MKIYFLIKKTISFLLIFTILLAVLSACSQEQMESAGEVTDFSSEKHFGVDDILQNGNGSKDESIPEESVSSTEISQDQSVAEGSTSETSKATDSSQNKTGEFVVSDKKYDYNGRNIMLLHVENKTNKDYDVTIKGKYLDKNGNILKEESQTYRGFPSEWKNYFIFHPRMAFDKFEYTIEVKEFKATTEIDQMYLSNGELLSKYVEFTYEKNIYWTRGGSSNVKDMVFNYRMINLHKNTPLTWQGHLLVLDENGEIYGTDYDYTDTWPRPEICFAWTSADPIGGYNDGSANCALRWRSADDDLTIPETVQGKFTVIYAVRCITNGDVVEKLKAEGKFEGVEIEGFTIN